MSLAVELQLRAASPVTTNTAQHKGLEINVNAPDLSQKCENQQLRSVNPAAARSGGSLGTLGTGLSPELGHLCSHRALHPCTTPNTSPSTPTPRVHSTKLGKDPLLQHRQAGGRIIQEIWSEKKPSKNLKYPQHFPPFEKFRWGAVVYFGVQRKRQQTGEQGMAAAFQRG